MKVIVEDLYQGRTVALEGTEHQVEGQLLDRFPWLGHLGPDESLHDLIGDLNSTQCFSAGIEEGNDTLVKSEDNLDTGAQDLAQAMIGFNPTVHPAFQAAQFLSGRPAAGLEAIRRGLYDCTNYVDAALQVYGFPVDDEHRESVRGVMKFQATPAVVRKSEPETPNQAQTPANEGIPAGRDIEPGVPAAQEAAAAARRAWESGQVRVAKLKGKHSRGSLMAQDPEDEKIWLLKPGGGGPGPAAGVAEDSVSQSRREAAFWAVALAWNLQESIPETQLTLIDGHEYAAIRMLPFSWDNMAAKLEESSATARQALSTYRDRGILHQWAVLDYVLGNPDRHGQNLMISGDNKLVALIDHGSAFAGPDFDPAFDRNSFVPYYLRAWAQEPFNELPTEEKLGQMPRVGRATEAVLRSWLDGIHADRLEMMLLRYGIDPRPGVDRLARLKVMTAKVPVDQAVNSLWVAT
jgi:hypothetical protein